MYMHGLSTIPCGCKNKGLNGLADSNAKATATATSQNTLTTQISPDISPNFIQQQQPQNSAVNASTSSSPSQTTIPGMPTAFPGVPGLDTSLPYFPNVPQNTVTTQPGFHNDILIYGALGAVGVGLLVKFMKRKKATA